MSTLNTGGRIVAERWPTERPLFAALVLLSLVIWLVLIVSVIGIIYALMIALFFFVVQLTFIAHIRGSGVRLGPDQFPDLHARIVHLAQAMEMEPPAAYLMQAGGSLNAFATRFLRRHLVVLYSDLLEACGEDSGARDMIITHELAHIRCGHLSWVWLTLPGHMVPFLGGALSRAREYTCDRYGVRGAGNLQSAVHGLVLLSAGPKFASQVNLQAFVRQRADLNTGFMTLGEWFGSHPPLARRIAAINPSLAEKRGDSVRGRVLALAILAVVALGGVGGIVTISAFSGKIMEALKVEEAARASGLSTLPDSAGTRVTSDFLRLSNFISAQWGEGTLPGTIEEVRDQWISQGNGPFPTDPYDGELYGYEPEGTASYFLWSSGVDGAAGTADDIAVRFGATPDPSLTSQR